MSSIKPFSISSKPEQADLSTTLTGVTKHKWVSALKKITFRKVLLKLHLYISLWLGGFLALAGITGSALVFDHTLDKWLNADIMQIEASQQPRLPLLELIAAANEASLIKSQPAFISMPEEPDEAIIVRYQIPEANKEHKSMNHHFYEVMVNPYNGHVLGGRDRNDSLMSIIVRLHANLLVGDTGKLLMGITALLTLVLTLTGIYLWWPKLNKIKQAFIIKRNSSFTRFNFDLHKTVGIYTALVMLSVALSGVYFNLPTLFKPVVNYFSPLDGMNGMSAMMGGVNSESTAGSAIPPEDIMKAVELAYPGIEIQRIYFPANTKDSYRVAGRQADEIRRSGATTVWLDQYTGKFLKIRDPKLFNNGTAFTNIQLPLHNGEILGDTGRYMVFITGIAPIVLMITGVIHWLKKRKAKTLHNARLASH
jgi:uncharacterized iron-regulated membrane protein